MLRFCSDPEAPYREALKIAAPLLGRLEPASVASAAGGRWHPDRRLLEVEFLGRTCRLEMPRCVFAAPVPPPKTRLLVLHYLLAAGLRPLRERGEYISFRELPAGIHYYPAFADRVARPLLERYGRFPGAFLRKAGAAGAGSVDRSDCSALFRVFPLVPVLFRLAPGDEELPPALSVLFDASLAGLLETEDAVVIGEEIAARLLQ